VPEAILALTEAKLTQGWCQATDGNLYGVTTLGGANTWGMIFKITLGGTFTTLYSFCSQPVCTDGSQPFAALVEATDGNFYGTTSVAGANSYGTVFKVTPGGTLTTLHSFNVSEGYSVAALVKATDGNFYGTTANGGTSNNCVGGCGTIFRITPTGTLSTLHSFDGSDGELPVGALAQAIDGNFYGTAKFGGAGSDGTVFSISVGLNNCASPQSKTHQEQCILESSLTSGSNFSVALHGQPCGTSS
jgi:uncharacterized repeat protein (TIGR03803 family)